jgi:nucleoid-associated protein YgaU
VFCAAMTAFTCALAHGQDVAEAARQEKARKAAEQQTPKHVYNDDDLKRKVILTPEDQTRVEARKKQQHFETGEQNASTKPQSPESTATESLGEIARRYRREKSERDAALAARKKFTPFPFDVPKDALAEPKIFTVPLTEPPGLIERHTELAPEVRPAPKLQPPVARDHRGRISPFEPRPLFTSPALVPPAVAIVPSSPVYSVPRVSETESRATMRPGRVELKSVQIVRGESWWRLAETYLGSGARWPELKKLNIQAGGPSELLKAGSVVVVPANGSAATASPQTITVSKGDSLWSLAEHHLGRGSAWSCLASANPQITDYTHLAVGTILQMPNGRVRSCLQTKADLVRR